jgi:hypothetical protein
MGKTQRTWDMAACIGVRTPHIEQNEIDWAVEHGRVNVRAVGLERKTAGEMPDGGVGCSGRNGGNRTSWHGNLLVEKPLLGFH